MGAELEVVNVTVEIRDAVVSQAGFGTPMIVAHHSLWPERVRTFSDPNALTQAPINMPTTHAIYRAAVKLMSQSPGPAQFKVGKRLGAVTHIARLIPSVPVQGEVFALEVNGTAVSVTAGVAPTVATICAALTSAITALPEVTAADNATHVTSTSDTTGTPQRYEALTPNLKVKDMTLDPATSIAADLAAIRAADPDWYWLVLDTSSEAELSVAAAWAESQKLIMVATTMDSEAWDGAVVTDIASDLELAGYHRSVLLYHEKPAMQYAAAAWVGKICHKAPGSYTAANKSLAGVDKSNLDDSKRGVLKGKTCNYYVDVKGIGFTLDGRAASGRYIDITHGIDWFEARVQERIISVLANNDKVPYTDAGASLFVSQIEAQILEGINVGLISDEEPWRVTVPKVRTISANTRAQRTLPDVKFSFVMQGAVHKVLINGTALTSAV